MKKIKLLAALFTALIMIIGTGCERVAPNYAGVLMENFGKDGKDDFSLVKGRVWTLAPGTELFQVPLFDQRGDFDGRMTLKASDNTEFYARPAYSYKVIEKRAIDVVFDNKQIDGGRDFMNSLEDNILEPRIYDLTKEESRKYSTEQLMADGGSLMFEKALEVIVAEEFEKRGLELKSFSAMLDFTDAVKNKVNERNEVNTDLSVLDQQIDRQRKQNELERLIAEQNRIRSSGITPQILAEEFIKKWDGRTPLYGSIPEIIKMQQ